MAVPFPEAQLELLIYMFLGSLITLVVVLSLYVRKLHQRMEELPTESQEPESKKPDLRVDNIGLSKRAEDILDTVLEEPKMQSELPSELEVSKATVSNGVSELKERGLIRRRKKANTYLIEPDLEKIKEEQK